MKHQAWIPIGAVLIAAAMVLGVEFVVRAASHKPTPTSIQYWIDGKTGVCFVQITQPDGRETISPLEAVYCASFKPQTTPDTDFSEPQKSKL